MVHASQFRNFAENFSELLLQAISEYYVMEYDEITLGNLYYLLDAHKVSTINMVPVVDDTVNPDNSVQRVLTLVDL